MTDEERKMKDICPAIFSGLSIHDQEAWNAAIKEYGAKNVAFQNSDGLMDDPMLAFDAGWYAARDYFTQEANKTNGE